jgi:hypothetical protein
MQQNAHDLTAMEVFEVMLDASINFMADGDRDAFVVRLTQSGVGRHEIAEQLAGLDTKRKEAFNQKLAVLAARHNHRRVA